MRIVLRKMSHHLQLIYSLWLIGITLRSQRCLVMHWCYFVWSLPIFTIHIDLLYFPLKFSAHKALMFTECSLVHPLQYIHLH